MNQPKPILAIKQKCKGCFGTKVNMQGSYNAKCKSCKGRGEQTTEIYALRDFEKCEEKWHKNFNSIRGKVKCYKCGFIRNEIGYKIPKEYEHYEIKKVCKVMWENKEITKLESGFEIFKKHKLKKNNIIITMPATIYISFSFIKTGFTCFIVLSILYVLNPKTSLL